MFGIGFEELIVILVIALIIVGPERMPELARQAGKAIRDLRRMYDNLRSDLGPDYDEVERAIRTLRSLDPRRELNSYSRKVLDELAKEAGPEAETLLHSSPAQISESLKQSLALPLGTITATGEVTTDGQVAGSILDPGASDISGESLEELWSEDERPSTGRPRLSRIYSVPDRDPPSKPHGPDPLIAQLGHNLLSDNLLDRPLKEAFAEPSSNGHEPS
jgi:sec-independent protein translocase protein TatB